MNNEFFIKIGVISTGVKEAFKAVAEDAKSVGENLKNVGKQSEKSNTALDAFKGKGAIFNKLNEATEGYAQKVSTIADGLGALFKSTFVGIKGLSFGAKKALLGIVGSAKVAKLAMIALRGALIATGIGALIVLVGVLISQFGNLKQALNGISKETQDQKKTLETQEDIYEHSLALINAGEGALKAQGKTQTEINNLKIADLKVLLQTRKELIENTKVALEGARARQKVFAKVIGAIVKVGVFATKIWAKVFDTFLNVNIKVIQFIFDRIASTVKFFAKLSDKLFKTDYSNSNLVKSLDGFNSLLQGLEVPNLAEKIDGIAEVLTKKLTPDNVTELEEEMKNLQIQTLQTESAIANLSEANQKNAINLKVGDIDAEVAKLESSIAIINEALSTTTDFDIKKGLLEQNFALEAEIIKKNYEKQLFLTEEGGSKRLKAESDYLTAQTNLRSKYAGLNASAIDENSAKEISAIKTASATALQAKIDAFNKDVNLNLLSQKEQQAHADTIATFKREANNLSLAEQNVVWEKLLAGTLLNGQQRIAIQQVVENNIAQIKEASYTKQLTDLEVFQQNVRTLMQDGIEGGLGNFGEAIGNAFANGKNIAESAGGALLSSIGGIMVKYGKLAIAFGLTSEALKKTMEAPFGGGAVAVIAGIALVAIGSAIKGFGANVASGGSGGSSGGSGGGASSSSGGGVSTTFSGGGSGAGSSGQARVVFEIGGDKLIGVLNNVARSNNRTGDTQTLITD